MPLSDLFTYEILDSEKGIVRAHISIDQNHKLFKGHFPGKPVTPGVALLEIVRLILSEFMAKDLMLSQAKDIKFVASVVPPKMQDLELKINYTNTGESLNANCILSGNDQVYMKIRGIFSESK